VKKDVRRRARESALQILYHWEIGRTDLEQAIETFFTRQWPDAGGAPEALREQASLLARETVRRLPAIDPLIAQTTERWRPERMAVLDR
jgi:transcription termination factor NusB